MRRVGIVLLEGASVGAAHEALRAALGLGAAGLDVRVWAADAALLAGGARATGALAALGRPVSIGGDLAAFLAPLEAVEVWR